MPAAVAVVKGGLFEQAGLTSLTQIRGVNSIRRRIQQYLSDQGALELRARMLALDGVAPGANATKVIPQVEANQEQGGKRVITQKTLINRNTTAADVTEINLMLASLTSRTTFGANPPANKDGNPLGTR